MLYTRVDFFFKSLRLILPTPNLVKKFILFLEIISKGLILYHVGLNERKKLILKNVQIKILNKKISCMKDS